MHEGQLDGIGRKNWTSDQIQRFSGGTKNKLAIELLDYCEEEGFISKLQRKGKLTTVQRFATKDVFQEHFGIDNHSPNGVRRTISKGEFDRALEVFMDDLIKGDKVHSRMNKSDVSSYARDLKKSLGLTSERIEPSVLSEVESQEKVRSVSRKKKPKAPSTPISLTYSDEISKELDILKNGKLQSLYYSMVHLELADHTPIIAVGTWCFLECLTAAQGRPSNNDFVAFLSKQKISELGITNKQDCKVINAALKRIQSYGNDTKYHSTAATFNGVQLNNDLEIIRDLILLCIKDASKNTE